jgi:gliding motility-associated-like protein
MKIFLLFFLLFTSAISKSFSQNQSNVWYFGNKAGITFNTNPPTALNDGVLTHAEGISSICDKNGELLFFTNGIQVWNSDKIQMPNGFGLLGNNSSTQVQIVPKPNDCDIYYIFTTPSQGNSGALSYSEVNMSLNGGLGDVVNKNTTLTTAVSERITATLKQNGIDYWVIAQSAGSHNFLTYAVTAAGVSTTAIVSQTGADEDAYGTSDAIGYMKISPNGAKLCYASETGFHKCYLYDFDNSTGMVSNGFLLSDLANYGAEFSPDNSKLYLCRYGNFKLVQYDLSTNNATTIVNSAIVLVEQSSSNIQYGGALQLGPDNKIYIARSNKEALDVIDKPNLLGNNCNYISNAIALNGNICFAGLPNFVAKYSTVNPCGKLTASFIHTSPCGNDDVTITVIATFGSSPYLYSIDGSNFQTSNTFTNLPNGEYEVTVKDAGSRIKKVSLPIPQTNSLQLATLNIMQPNCGDNNGSVTLKASNGLEQFQYSKNGIDFQNSNTFSNLNKGLYQFVVKDANGCIAKKTLQITDINNHKVFAGRDTGIFINQTLPLFAIDKTNSSFVSYSWEPSYGLDFSNIQNPIATIDKNIEYTVTATNQRGCIAVDTIRIAVYKEVAIFVPTAFTPNNDKVNDVLRAIPRGIKILLYFNIFNRYGQLIFSTTDFAKGWDGKLNNIEQNTSTYTWHAEGIDIKGNKIYRKGYFTLLR